MPAAHNNHGLFSDHYLARHLPELSGEELAQAQRDQQALREIYARGVPHAADGKEAACEQWLLRPVMEVLGFARFEKPPLPTEETTFEPDYALFASPEDIPEGAGDDPDAFYSAALAIAEAKRWDRDLGSAERDDDSASRRQHPGAQTRRYLFESGVRWGILTNGRLWRIYERERSRAGFRYYEVDLPALLEADVHDFRYFWLLFRRAAYRPDDSGQSPIGRVLDESRRYWLDITDRLRDRVYDALETLMTGMIEGSPALSEHDLPAVHEASLIVLYRLLFCFYAEARNLLPMSNPVYRHNHSAQTKLSEVAQRRDTSGGAWSHSGRALWQWFRDLSRIINEGDPGETGVPEYDGGLFDPQEWPLLSDPSVAVPDVHMAEVIDRIGRDWDRDTDERAFLDYSELTVRELGSIYEGLLEMRPHWRDGSVELLTDRGERKATGSYYTPEYIVDYIVTNTLDPLLTDAAAQVKDRLPRYEAQIAERERLIEDRGPDHPENAKTLRTIDDLKLELLEPYFELMVLDPAMGSGHFLVAASEEITEAIITDPSHRPPSEAADEDDENIYYKRRVVERCLYGVDLNPLAVELAKLSLWLHTVEFGKPLSFLKHHLREGNSLIGARLSEMHRLPNGPAETSGQLNLFTQSFMPEATRMLQAFNLIERMPTDTLAQERDKEAAWEEIERRRERFRQVANVWLSTYFGNTVDDADYARAVDALGSPAAFGDIEREEWFADAQRLAREHDFFHWELEFPDAFFTEQGPKPEKERGFDAVVGNPPWEVLISSEVPRPVLDYVNGTFDTAQYNPNTFALFLELGASLLQSAGWMGEIVPDAWLTGTYFTNLRQLFIDRVCLNRVLLCGEAAFPEIIATSMVLVGYRGSPTEQMIAVQQLARLGVEPTDEALVPYSEVEHDPRMPWRCLLLGSELQLQPSRALGESYIVYRGLETVDNERYLARVASTPEDRPILTGSGMSRYFIPWDGTHVHFIPAEMKSNADIAMYDVPAKLLMRRTGDQVLVALDTSRRLALKNVYVVLPRKAAALRPCFVLTVLNSAAVQARHRALARNAGTVFAQFSAEYIEDFPIRIIDFDHPTDEALKEEALARCREAVEAGDYETPFVLARAALAAHAAAHGPAGKPELREDDYWAGEIEWLADAAGGDCSAVSRTEGPPERAGERQRDRARSRPAAHDCPSPDTTNSRADFGAHKRHAHLRAAPPTADDIHVADLREDLVHDLLAWLAQRMIDLNERKHEEKQGFLRWLERTLGCEIDDLSGKTLIRDYDDRESLADFDALCSRLCSAANRRKMTADPRSRATQERVQGEYERSMETLDALNASLAATDALIDRIVYALYGLGPEEIAIIEDSAR